MTGSATRVRLTAALLLLAVACGGDPVARPASTPPPPVTTVTLPPSATPTARPTTAPPSPRVPLPRSMAAIGDSITRAFLGCANPTCPEASWSTGTLPAVDSHATRLGRLAGRPVRTHNLAVGGSRVTDLDAQAAQAAATGAAYVTVLIGTNDACRSSVDAMTPVPEYAAAFDRALTTLTRGLPRARVLVASIPSLPRLLDVGRAEPRVVRRWERLGICPSLLADPPTGSRAAVRERIEAYNAAMAAACARRPLCRWDGGAVYAHPFTLDEVSPHDWFHPDGEGQRTLAEITWRAGFWG